jgi:hypothetical protein
VSIEFLPQNMGQHRRWESVCIELASLPVDQSSLGLLNRLNAGGIFGGDLVQPGVAYLLVSDVLC